MVGNKSGVATLLKVDHPEVVTVHCLAHRLDLAFKDAFKTTAKSQHDRLTTLLVGPYYFYRYNGTLHCSKN